VSATDDTGACDRCLRRSRLIAHLAPRITGLLGRRGGRASGLLALSEEQLIAAAGGTGKRAVRDELARFDAAAERAQLAAAATFAVCRHSASYPPQLAELPDPPAALFCVGDPEALIVLGDVPAVAIVGTRRPSPYGTEVAYALGRGLGAAGVTVVSGLALGIDATAHRGCLDGSGTAVAVLACGPERAYPRRHRRLHEQVAERGVVLSELPPGTQAQRWSFPARNRIMAGLARLTLVVEAAEPSGSLITADFARDLGRGVAAVPGRVTARMAAGTNGLLRDGAVPVTSTEDVLDELFGVGLRPEPPGAPGGGSPVDAALRDVLDAVEAGAGVDDIVRRTRSSAAEVRAALGRLEADGHVVRGVLGGWERTAM
jgi:DNA processing protein